MEAITKDKPLTAKQASFVQYYADPGSDTYNNKKQSAIKAGYAKEWAAENTTQITNNNQVKQAIRVYRVKISTGLEHNREIAVEMLCRDYACLEDKALAGDIQAIQARTQITKELNTISHLRSLALPTGQAQDEGMSEQQASAAHAAAEAYKRTMAIKPAEGHAKPRTRTGA